MPYSKLYKGIYTRMYYRVKQRDNSKESNVKHISWERTGIKGQQIGMEVGTESE